MPAAFPNLAQPLPVCLRRVCLGRDDPGYLSGSGDHKWRGYSGRSESAFLWPGCLNNAQHDAIVQQVRFEAFRSVTVATFVDNTILSITDGYRRTDGKVFIFTGAPRIGLPGCRGLWRPRCRDGGHRPNARPM